MATGTYKSGVAIIVSYQAVDCATGKTVTMDIYDEAHAKDVAKCVASMTEYAATGRYYATFTPDAEGEWLAVMENTTDGNGEVLKAFAVTGHDVDSVGDAVATIDGEISTIDTEVGNLATALQTVDDEIATIDGEIETIDTEVGNNTTAIGVIDAFHDVPSEDSADDVVISDVVGKKSDTTGGNSLVALSKINAGKIDTIDGEIETIDTEVGNNTTAIGVIDGYHDVPGEDSADDAQARDVIGKKSDTVAGNSVIALAKQLLADTGSTGSIRGADDDTLKSLSDQIDVVSAPAMVG